MPVLISLPRGINVGGHNLIKMEALRALYASLGFSDPQTYVQSGNVVFRAEDTNTESTARRIEDAIERKFGFRPEVVVRTSSEIKDVLARNPFAKRKRIEPSRLLINFLTELPDAAVREAILSLKHGAEEVRMEGREIYLYSPDGIGQSKLWPAIGRRLKNAGTGRNLNTVQKLLEMAEKLDA